MAPGNKSLSAMHIYPIGFRSVVGRGSLVAYQPNRCCRHWHDSQKHDRYFRMLPYKKAILQDAIPSSSPLHPSDSLPGSLAQKVYASLKQAILSLLSRPGDLALVDGDLFGPNTQACSRAVPLHQILKAALVCIEYEVYVFHRQAEWRHHAQDVFGVA